MMTSSSISAHDLLTDHPLPGIQLVTPTADHLDHGGHYCQNWVSHQHWQLDQHNKDQVGSDDGVLNQVMDTEKGLKVWAWDEQNDDLYDPWIRSADMDSDNIHDIWVPNSSKFKVVKKLNPKGASKANTAPVVEMSTDDFPYFQPADQNDSSSNGNNNNNRIRVCSDCKTTKTPLWRSGPKGPKSLCNACGIRQRKARRAQAAAAGSSDNNALTKATTRSPKSLKIKISNNTKEKTTSTTGASHDDTMQGWQQPYKKRLKQADHYHQSPYTSASHDSNPSSGKDSDDHQCFTPGERNNNKRICFEEFITMSLSKNAALHRVFPRDEKEAAILLLALSCGLVYS